MNKGKIVLIILGFIVLCSAYYCLFPKYEFKESGDPGSVKVYRYNRITGKAEVFQLNATGEIRRVIWSGRLF